MGYHSEMMRKKCSEAESRTSRTSEIEDNKYLKTAYESLGGENWANNTGWMNDTIPHCEWFGVRCNEFGLVRLVVIQKCAFLLHDSTDLCSLSSNQTQRKRNSSEE